VKPCSETLPPEIAESVVALDGSKVKTVGFGPSFIHLTAKPFVRVVLVENEVFG
jgi:hypothetical protein